MTVHGPEQQLSGCMLSLGIWTIVLAVANVVEYGRIWQNVVDYGRVWQMHLPG